MAIFDKVMDKFGYQAKPTTVAEVKSIISDFVVKAEDEGIFKAYIPEFLYKPPFGYPRKVNTVELKKLSKNPYVFSVVKNICDAAASTPWEIKVKEEFQEDGNDYKKEIDEITKFFKNPNGNEESWEFISRQLVTDICETDSGVLVKIFNNMGEFKQIFCRDGSLFLKNPDIYGYIGDRDDFVPPLPTNMDYQTVNFENPTEMQASLIHNYEALYKHNAAYYQYGWTAGSFPIPFGKREIVYMMQNPRSDTIYGRSPIEILYSVLLNLVYGVEYNLDFYVNSNMPDGIISLLGANGDQLEQFRDNFESQFRFKDDFGKKRKIFNKIPVSGTEVSFTPFQLSSKDMEVIAQQQWFTKVLWMCFGVTADEMGFTEDSSKNVSKEQVSVAKRKAVKPMLKNIQYHVNTQIMTEWFENKDFSEIPLEFCYDDYDHDDDKKKHDLLDQEIRMGVKTPEMAAKELGINVDELKESQQENMQQEIEKTNAMNPNFAIQDNNPEPKKEVKKEVKKESKKEPEEKSTETNVLKELDSYFNGMGKALISEMDKIPENEYKD